MMFRIVAGESGRSSVRERLSDPTGAPVAIWSWMRDLRTSRLRSSRTGLAMSCWNVSGAHALQLYPDRMEGQAFRVSSGGECSAREAECFLCRRAPDPFRREALDDVARAAERAAFRITTQAACRAAPAPRRRERRSACRRRY